jgi:hypothetical protein
MVKSCCRGKVYAGTEWGQERTRQSNAKVVRCLIERYFLTPEMMASWIDEQPSSLNRAFDDRR